MFKMLSNLIFNTNTNKYNRINEGYVNLDKLTSIQKLYLIVIINTRIAAYSLSINK